MIAWLRQVWAERLRQLDEDERVAREASRGWNGSGYTEGGEHWRWEECEHDQVLTLDPVGEEYLNDGSQVALRSVEQYPTGNPWTLQHHVVNTEEVLTVDAMHIARHDPARVLADVEQGRQDVEARLQVLDWLDDLDRWERHADVIRMPDTDKARKLLAQPYAGQPGWREEWTA